MKIKILFDPDGDYGYGKRVVDAEQVVSDYIDSLNPVEEKDTISELKEMSIEKAIDFVADMWRLDYEIAETTHYRVNIGHYKTECFHHFDDEEKMFSWISSRIGQKVSSFDDCEAWTRRQDNRYGSYIEILFLGNLKDFYKQRRAYVQKVRECEDAFTKAQRKISMDKRAVQMIKSAKAYDKAQSYWEMYPEVWQGEI